MITVKDHEFVLVEHEKRRFLRVFLDKPLSGMVNMGMIDINIRIFDISEEGVGFFAVCDRDLLRFKGSSININFVLDNKNYISTPGRFAWLSKYGYNKYIGGIQIKPTVEQRYAILTKLRKARKLTDKVINDTLRETRLALLEADTDYQVVKDFLKRVRERALGQEVKANLTPAETIITIVYEELVNILGSQKEDIRKGVSLFVGLQGTGKTTTIAKIANFLKGKGFSVGVRL